MGGTNLRLISSPLPIVYPLRRFGFHRHPRCSNHHLHYPFPLICSNAFSTSIPTYNNDHPWPQFLKFMTRVSLGANQLDFLAFARAFHFPTLLWSLPREHIEVVVGHGYAYASAAVARINIFLAHRLNNLSRSDEPNTADLMEFLLSYAHMAIGCSEDMRTLSRDESCVRKLFSKLANSKRTQTESLTTSQKEFSDSYVKAPMSFGKNVEKKKGDWTCPRCSFMNFAKNSQCLQCEEHRPKKFLLGGEWECPQCNFCNFGRNVVCLRCDCKKPAVNLTSDSGWRVDLPLAKGNTNTKKINSGVEEQQWFTKITELERSSDMNNALTYEDMPETMKATDNRFGTIARGSGVIDSHIQSNLQTTVEGNDINVNISQGFEEDICQNTSPDMNKNRDLVNKSRDSNFSAMYSAAFQYEQHNEPEFGLDTDVPTQQQMSDEKDSSQLESKDNESEQVKRSEKRLKKVTEFHDVQDLPNAVSQDKFSEIMPMRKGDNQFVVSKKKDRSLSSPMYKRRLAMEQADMNNYVPFTPFPAGYFAKNRPKEGSESTQSIQQSGATSLDSGVTGGEKRDESGNNPTSNNVNQLPKGFDSHLNSLNDNLKSHSFSENASVKESWSEMSLEGSAVKESDPLDMSEDAKAERWFRRVAQIKDISELSQIPDEDFPSIMPMRKGVNRFVVSKRKTPSERRLTSSQYRRNLPVEGSDPVKQEIGSD